MTSNVWGWKGHDLNHLGVVSFFLWCDLTQDWHCFLLISWKFEIFQIVTLNFLLVFFLARNYRQKSSGDGYCILCIFPILFKQHRCCQFLVLLSSVEIPGKWSHSSAFWCLVEIGSQRPTCFFFQHKLTKPDGILQGLRYVGGAFWSSLASWYVLVFPWYSKHLWAFRIEQQNNTKVHAVNNASHQMANQQGVLPIPFHTLSWYILTYHLVWFL